MIAKYVVGSVAILTAPFWTFIIGALLLYAVGGNPLVAEVFRVALNADLFLITLYLVSAANVLEALVNGVIMLLNSTAGTNFQFVNFQQYANSVVELFKSFANL